ncbi:hypothetical protein H5410_056145 [Solanum commersonii]|uniref:Uncharacterized protein n=1 Tax=Solanum commersonii TaxID=4109 RepID=A0A9J5WJG6_SOLCO|nr:hypothetical protein H5410_056145 [Solanum commersonii]
MMSHFMSLEDLEGAMVRMVTRPSFHDTSMIGSGGSHSTREIITQPSSVGYESGIDSLIEATPAIQSSPQA